MKVFSLGRFSVVFEEVSLLVEFVWLSVVPDIVDISSVLVASCVEASGVVVSAMHTVK